MNNSNSTKNKTVRTRMAPSPTGEMHVGSMATLLKNYAWAKRNNGQFILRIEDTDKTREVEGGVGRIQQIIKDYGLDWDEGPGKDGQFGPYIQSDRKHIYQEHIQTLLQKGAAYHCFCTRERLEEVREQMRAQKKPPKYDRHCRHLTQEEIERKLNAKESSVVRLVVPDNVEVKFTDLIRGEISFNSDQVDDQVLMKSDGFPTYHFAVVVDDHLMQISHIMRGEEWISSTPKHILLYQAFGWDLPVFAHLPLFLNPNGKGKMSKRYGDVSAQSFLDQGYLPEAMLNFFMILGWAKSDQEEIISLDEYIQEFDPADISASGVAFDLVKLEWLNGMYIRKLSLDELQQKIKPFVPQDCPQLKVKTFLELIKERMVRLNQFEELTAFFYREISVDPNLVLKKGTPDLVHDQLIQTIDQLQEVKEWQTQDIEEVIRNLQEKNDWKKGQYFMMLRVAVTGSKATPPLFETIQALDKDIAISRLNHCIQIIK